MTSILKTKPAALALAFAGLAGLLYGCGSASNNDQGTTFTATGFFADSTGATGDTGAVIALGRDVPTLQTDGNDFGVADPVRLDGRAASTFIGLQNRFGGRADTLADDAVFIRTERIDCDYEIPGSDIGIPSDSNPLGTVIEAGGSAFAEFLVISPDLFSFLNVNRNSLPELPFRMNARCSAVGVTRNGATITTNPVNYLILVADAAECCTGVGVFGGGGFQEGEGTGGTPDFFGGDDTTGGTGTGGTGTGGTGTGGTGTATEEDTSDTGSTADGDSGSASGT